jgi:hypothetical protein
LGIDTAVGGVDDQIINGCIIHLERSGRAGNHDESAYGIQLEVPNTKGALPSDGTTFVVWVSWTVSIIEGYG